MLRLLEQVGSYLCQQLTRLVKWGGERGPLTKRYLAHAQALYATYTSADVHLLTASDTVHSTLSGLATKKLLERAYRVFASTRYEGLAVSTWRTCASRRAISAPPGVD